MERLKYKRRIYEVTQGLKSPRTQEEYRRFFGAFLKHEKTTPERLLRLDPKKLEDMIAEYLLTLNERGLSHSSINCAKCAIVHFFVINRNVLNVRWISKFIKPNENHKEDRAYSEDEIQKFIAIAPDERYRVIFLLLATTGMRVGAIPELRIGDLTKTKFPSMPQESLYVIWVYNRSADYRYYCFATPELTKSIDVYLDYRKQFGEVLTPDSPLVREQFNIDKPEQGRYRTRRMNVKTFQTALTKLKRKAGLYSSLRGQVHLTNGFRKRCMTQMIAAKVDYDTREYLIGHKRSRGLNVHYDRTDHAARFAEWSKAIDLLTVSREYHQRLRIAALEGEQNTEMSNLRKDVDRMKEVIRRMDLVDLQEFPVPDSDLL